MSNKQFLSRPTTIKLSHNKNEINKRGKILKSTKGNNIEHCIHTTHTHTQTKPKMPTKE